MFNIVKGTHDITRNDARKYSYIENLLVYVAENYGFQEFRTPILEHTELFTRSTGESSDVVRKEMYTFLDKGERSITLRPEMTAGIIRCMVNEKMFANQDFPVKAYYVGPNFRYERPQAGRYRQFNQFGVECVGVNDIFRDIEVMIMGYNSLKMLGFKNVKLVINSLGDEETRTNYQKALREYYESKIDEMCEDCKERLNINVLRILDCKVPHDIEINKNAPLISDFYSEKAKSEFEIVKNYLTENEIEFEVDSGLVRGLDYYTGIVFEYNYTSQSGLNNGALGGGGHYGKLVKEVGGPDLEGVGFAFGIERLFNLMEDDNLFGNVEEYGLDFFVMPLGDEARSIGFNLACYLRNLGYSADLCLESKGFGQMFKKAERRNTKFAIIVGEEEIENNKLKIKNMATQDQVEIDFDELPAYADSVINDVEEHHHCCCGDDCDCDCDCDCECDEHEHDHGHGCCCHHKED